MPGPSPAGRGWATTTCPRPGCGGSRSTWPPWPSGPCAAGPGRCCGGAAALVPELSPDLLDLRDALAALPLGQRQVIVLHHLVGPPVEEVARELRLAPGTVKSRLARGRAAMAGSLDHDSSEVTS